MTVTKEQLLVLILEEIIIVFVMKDTLEMEKIALVLTYSVSLCNVYTKSFTITMHCIYPKVLPCILTTNIAKLYHYTMHCIYPKVLPCILTTNIAKLYHYTMQCIYQKLYHYSITMQCIYQKLYHYTMHCIYPNVLPCVLTIM